jgi:hypothetical protein
MIILPVIYILLSLLLLIYKTILLNKGHVINGDMSLFISIFKKILKNTLKIKKNYVKYKYT